ILNIQLHCVIATIHLYSKQRRVFTRVQVLYSYPKSHSLDKYYSSNYFYSYSFDEYYSSNYFYSYSFDEYYSSNYFYSYSFDEYYSKKKLK
ncbi:hypothetical protein BpHYR1_022445, partial [Brachionus plicatilis]